MTSTRFRTVLACAVAALAATATALAATYTNSTPIDVADASGSTTPGVASSTINVGETGTVSSVTVTLFDVTHESPDDLDIALRSPAGAAVLLMSDAGGGFGGEAPPDGGRRHPNAPIIAPADITFSDAAATSLPDDGQISSGSYKPSNYGPTPDPFCSGEGDAFGSGGPVAPFGTTLASLHGGPTQGNWVLWVADDCQGFGGVNGAAEIAGGWRLTVNTPTAARISALAASPTRHGIVVRWRSANEADVAGYNVFRAAGRELARVNRALVAAKASGTVRGASYRIADPAAKARKAYTYRLQVVRLDGSRYWAGIAAVQLFG